MLAPQQPDSFREMEPLFLAVICGCNVGLFHDALHEVYFHVSSGAINPLPQTFSGLEARCSRLWPPFSNRDTGARCGKSPLEGQALSGEDKLLHSHPGRLIPDVHAKPCVSGGANLLRARRILVSLPESSSALVCHTGQSVALFRRDRQAVGSDAAR